MIRIGLVGVNTSHADAFAHIFNGTVDEAARMDSGKVVSIWGDDPERIATTVLDVIGGRRASMMNGDRRAPAG